MGAKTSSAPPTDPRLVDAQIASMGVQNDAIKALSANSTALLPLQRAQLKFGLDSAKTAYDQNQEQYGVFKKQQTQLLGLQRKAQDAADLYSSDDYQNKLAGQGMADVEQGAAAARAGSVRDLTRMGLDPSSGRFAAMTAGTNMNVAAAKAQAANMARTAAKQLGWNLQDRAAGMLTGASSGLTSSIGTGAGFGASGLGLVNTGLQGMNMGFNDMGRMAGSLGQNAAGMYGAQAGFKSQQDQLAASSDPFMTILGAAAGVGTSWGLNKFVK